MHTRKQMHLMFLLILISYVVLNYVNMAQPRGVELYVAKAVQNKNLFIFDEFAQCSLNNANAFFVNVLSSLTDFQKQVSYIIVYFSTVFLLWMWAWNLTGDKNIGWVFALMIVYSPLNHTNLHYELLGNEFKASFFAGPFIISGLWATTTGRLFIAASLFAVAFYIHPGICLWSIMALLCGGVFMSCLYAVGRQSMGVVKKYAYRVIISLVIVTLAVIPKIYFVMTNGSSVSMIDAQERFDIFKYGWFSQTSIWLGYLFYNDSSLYGWIITTVITLFMLVIVIGRLRHETDERLKFVCCVAVGSFVGLILNEIAIHMFDIRLNVLYGFCRMSFITSLFLLMILAQSGVKSFYGERKLEMLLWIIFFVDYFFVHKNILSSMFSVLLLATIIVVNHYGWNIKRNIFIFHP